MNKPEVYFFDMDHTLQNNDSDVSWKEFLVAEKLAPADTMEIAAEFFEQYKRGELDFPAFVRFQLREFAGNTPETMRALARQHFIRHSLPCIYPGARQLVDQALASGCPVAILSATNSYLCAPFAAHFNIGEVIATEPELKNGVFTGDIVKAYCCGEGKIIRAREFCEQRGLSLERAAYYGDSVSDIHILEAVGFPCAVNPAPRLRELAQNSRWPVIDL